MTLLPRRPARVLVVAASGYGKSAAVDQELPLDAVRLTAEEAVSGLPAATSWIAVDDVDRLDEQDRAVVLGHVDDAPAEVGVVVISRHLIPERSFRGSVVHRGADVLALEEYDVARVLADEYALDHPELAVDVHRATGGWPMLVHLVAERLPASARTIDPAAAAEAVRGWVEEHVLPDVPAHEQAVLGSVLRLGPVVPPLLPKAAIARLERLGVLRPDPGGGWRAVPVVERCLSGTVDRAALPAVAAAYEGAGLWAAAGVVRRETGDRPGVVELLEAHGDAMLRRGQAPTLLDLVDDDVAARSERAAVLRADAWRMVGDGPRAARAWAPLLAAAAASGRWSRELTTRAAATPYLRGDAAAAVEILDRCPEPHEGDDPADAAEWLGQRAHCLAQLGRGAEAERSAGAALRVAEADGGPRALLAAHVAMARVSGGARKAAHLGQAADVALAADDLVALARVRTNQAHFLLAEARYAEAVEPARAAVVACGAVSPPGMLCAAIHNLAEALARSGRFDEAVWHYRRTVELGGRLGPGRSALGMLGTAQVQHELGRADHARACYRDAAELARGTGEVQVLVPALSGLARLDSDASLAREALRIGTPATHAWARAALAAISDDHRAAHEAVAAAEAAGSLDQLAEALEVAALTTDDAARARALLGRARTIWSDGGAAPATARIDVLLARLPGADALDRARAGTAVAYLQRLGVVDVDGVPLTAELSAAEATIQVLGGFAVRLGDTDVPLTAWRSRQARTLVKVLVARRGRPTPRAALAELLWPDDDPARTGHRLSVLLATVRGVLDPGKRWPTEHFIAADRLGVWLDLAHVDVDAEGLLRDVALAVAEHDAGRADRALEIMVDLDRRHRGDALEDEAGEPWSDALREEVRAAYLRGLQLQVAIHRSQRRAHDVTRLLVRLLAFDPYDERAHRQLVRTLSAARRYGEARRAFERWSAAMAELDAPPPDPGVLADALVLTPR